MDARKEPLDAESALELAKKASKIYAVKGKKVTLVDRKKEEPDDETLKKLIVGPSGNLRAPALRIGKTLVVGFHEEAYEEALQ